MTDKFISIISFPKSGNTWIRSFISHLCFDGSLEDVPDKYQSNIFKAPAYRLQDGTSVKFYKSHDRVLTKEFDDQKISHAAIIHIRRHPLDVFLSHLNFLHLPIDKNSMVRPSRNTFLTEFKSIEEIIEKNYLWIYFGTFIIYGTLNPQFVSTGSWFSNTRYWMKRSGKRIPHFRYRYEDLLKNKADELQGLGRFLGKSESDVEKAFRAAQTSTQQDGAFFWKQRAGLYKELLDPEHIRIYRELFGDELRTFDYEV